MPACVCVRACVRACVCVRAYLRVAEIMIRGEIWTDYRLLNGMKSTLDHSKN